MRRISRLNRAAVLLTVCLVSSCSFVREMTDDCSRSICGCSRDATILVEIKLSRDNSEPIPDAALICHDPDDGLGKAMGITNSLGLVSMEVPGYSSPGCGFFPDCKIAYFRTKERGFERPFWFGRVVRGTNDDATDRRIEVTIDGM